jgi:glycosyltransferase involved in cell wall biosynthesis
MTKSRVLICHPRLRPSGGGNVVAAWVLQALRSEFDVSLATLEPVNCQALNLSFGTCLEPGDFQVYVAPAMYQAMLRSLPTPGALLDIALTMRWAQDVDRKARFDLLFSTENEVDFHRRGIQYIHHPWLYLPRPEPEMRWYHRLPGALKLYRKSCLALSRATVAGLGSNVTLANSRFVAARFRHVYGTDAEVVHPPVPGDFPETSWAERRLAVAGIGRIHHYKRWDVVVEIVEAVRKRGHDLKLTLIGHSDEAAYEARLEAMTASRPWFRLLRNLSRAELLSELSQHRYGIHAMHEEHFGIAPAELQRAGCIPFVHNSGGPVEIVDDDPRLTFDTVEDASEKITRAIEDSSLERELRTQVAERRDWFSSERFCESVRRTVMQAVRDATDRTQVATEAQPGCPTGLIRA